MQPFGSVLKPSFFIAQNSPENGLGALVRLLDRLILVASFVASPANIGLQEMFLQVET